MRTRTAALPESSNSAVSENPNLSITDNGMEQQA